MKAAKEEIELDQRGDGLYSGTFRWTEKKKFPALPVRTKAIPTAWLEKGWHGYLSQCHGNNNLIPLATQDPSFLDALSFPLTFINTAIALDLPTQWNRNETLHVIVGGATIKAEQRIFTQTKYWDEIAAFFPEFRIKLWFVGPEVAPFQSTSSVLQVDTFRGTTGAFLAAHKEMTPQNAVFVGYNTGFGNFVESNRFDLLWSWLPDLYAMADSGIVSIFACANDYADLNGEFAIHTRVLGSNMLLLPKENPFSAASHLHEEGKKDTAWSRANSFLYVVQGFTSGRRHQLRIGDNSQLSALLDRDLDDLHLMDRLGRHFFNGTILSKKQAAAHPALSKLKEKASAHDNQNEVLHEEKHSSAISTPTPQESKPPATSNQASHEITTPEYNIVTNMDNTQMRITISTPLMESAKDMQLDLSTTKLRFHVPDMYKLEIELPWKVSGSGDCMQAIYTKRTRTLCVELRAASLGV